MLPWELPDRKEKGKEYEDPFRIPILAALIREEYRETRFSKPTIILPTRHSVKALTDTIGSFPDLCPGTLRLVHWIREILDNDGQQYSLVSHLETKQAAIEPIAQSASLLRQFLLQTELPQRVIRNEEGAGGSEISEAGESSSTDSSDEDHDEDELN